MGIARLIYIVIVLSPGLLIMPAMGVDIRLVHAASILYQKGSSSVSNVSTAVSSAYSERQSNLGRVTQQLNAVTSAIEKNALLSFNELGDHYRVNAQNLAVQIQNNAHEVVQNLNSDSIQVQAMLDAIATKGASVVNQIIGSNNGVQGAIQRISQVRARGSSQIAQAQSRINNTAAVASSKSQQIFSETTSNEIQEVDALHNDVQNMCVKRIAQIVGSDVVQDNQLEQALINAQTSLRNLISTDISNLATVLGSNNNNVSGLVDQALTVINNGLEAGFTDAQTQIAINVTSGTGRVNQELTEHDNAVATSLESINAVVSTLVHDFTTAILAEVDSVCNAVQIGNSTMQLRVVDAIVNNATTISAQIQTFENVVLERVCQAQAELSSQLNNQFNNLEANVKQVGNALRVSITVLGTSVANTSDALLNAAQNELIKDTNDARSQISNIKFVFGLKAITESALINQLEVISKNTTDAINVAVNRVTCDTHDELERVEEVLNRAYKDEINDRRAELNIFKALRRELEQILCSKYDDITDFVEESADALIKIIKDQYFILLPVHILEWAAILALAVLSLFLP